MKQFILPILLLLFATPIIAIEGELDYFQYHQQVIEAEKQIVAENYAGALGIYESLFEEYDFIFLREYQIAAQLAWKLNEKEKTAQYLQRALLAGWTLSGIKSNQFLKPIRSTPSWEKLKKGNTIWKKQFEFSLHDGLLETIKPMYKKDQRKAFLALFTFGSKAQDRYAEKRFAPHSEMQLVKLKKILERIGYPGEQFVGNQYWTSTILSHHNSISKAYNQKDSLYTSIRPMLLKAIQKGEMAPFELMLIDDWYNSTIKANQGYGILKKPKKSELQATNKRRAAIGMRSIELRNQLIEIEEKTGMNFYLGGGPWVKGKIKLSDE